MNPGKTAAKIWGLILVGLKMAWDFMIYVIEMIPVVISLGVQLVITSIPKSWIGLIMLVVQFSAFFVTLILLLILVFMNFYPEIAIWVWYYLDYMWVTVLNIIIDLYNILLPLFGYLGSGLNYPIEVIRIFLYESYDALCEGESTFNCLGGDTWIWFIQMHLNVFIEWLHILDLFTVNLRIAMTEFICQQGILIVEGDPYFCFTETTALVITSSILGGG